MRVGPRSHLTSSDLKHRVRLQDRVNADDGMAGSTVTYADIATLWADVSNSGGKTLFEAKQASPELTHMIRLRYRPTITPRMRIVWGSRVFKIVAADDPDGNQIETQVLAQELVQEQSS